MIIRPSPYAFPDGTAALPGMFFGADLDTGISRPAANTTGIVTGGVERVRIDANGQVLIGDTANANVTTGLTINQGTADNTILALKSSDVAHGMTDTEETDTFFRIRKRSATGGGASFVGFSADTSEGILLSGIHTTVDTTKATTSIAAVGIWGYARSGASQGTLGANANILVVADAGTTRFILDSDGDSHQDVGTAWTNFDAYDDAALLHDLSVAVSRHDDPIRDAFRGFLRYNHGAMERAKLVTFNADGHHFVNMSRLTMLHTGAIRQLTEQHRSLQARLERTEHLLTAR